jgi:anti-sigma28 factor (negative regulator of flagellin synthesis)
MKVENAAINSKANDLYTRELRHTPQDVQSGSVGSRTMSDHISLSGASDLVSRARNLLPEDKLSRFEAISAMVSAGKYKTDAVAIGQALIDGHLES